MSLHLLPDWKRILKKAWSIRLNILAGILSSFEVILPVFVDSFPRGMFAGLSIVVITGSTIARVIAQKEMHG
jgi:hypothetical protein